MNATVTRYCLIVLLSIHGGSLYASAQTPPEAPVAAAAVADDGSLISVSKAIERAKSISLKEFPDADDVVVDAYTCIAYQPDGTYVERSDNFYKILTEKGRRDGSMFSLHYNETYGSARILLLAIYKPDGTCHPMDVEGQSRVMIDPEQMGDNIYDPKQKIMQIGLPDLQIGDCVRAVVTRSQTKTRVPNQYFEMTVMEHTSPILHEIWEVVAPKSLPLKWKVVRDAKKDCMTYAEKEYGDWTRHRWEARNVPRIFEEPGMPDFWTLTQRVLVSTTGSWEELSRWYWKLCLPQIEATTPEMKTTVDELVAGCGTPQAKIEALFGFVSQRIRYMGIMAEAEAPGYEPHAVRLTFENRYGVCRDKAALLVAMLRMAGLDAFPVLIKAGPRMDPEVPLPMFNHAIAAARVDGKYILMDPTDETTRELLPGYLDHCSFLVATPEGEKLLTSPVTPASEQLLVVDTTAELDAQGTMTGRVAMQFNGINDNIFRSMFSKQKPEQHRQLFERLMKTALPGAQVTSFELLPVNMQDRTQPLCATISFKAVDALIAGDRIATPSLPWLGNLFGALRFMLRDSSDLEKRVFPLKMDFCCGYREVITLKVAGAVGNLISLPAPVRQEKGALTFHRSYSSENGVLRAEAGAQLNAVEIAPADYAAFKDTLRAIEQSQRARPLFQPPADDGKSFKAETVPDADVALLQMDTTLEVSDEHTWTSREVVKKKILTYAGLKEESELKIQFNPAWESVEVTDVRVTAPDGRTFALTEKEQNLMDADWVGSAPRYPAGRILVVSLPGVSLGSTLEYTLVRHLKNRPYFHAMEIFSGSDPVDSRTLTIRAPSSIPLRRTERNMSGILFTLRKEGTHTALTWSGHSLPPSPKEPDAPPAWVHEPAVFVSSGDWATYAATLRAALEKASRRQAKAGKEGRRLTRDIQDPNKKIRSIRDFVSRNIRPAGPSFTELPLESLTPADKTLGDRYGNGADSAILLFAMLEGAGFQPEFVLPGEFDRRLSLQEPLLEAPQPGLFHSVLVRVGDSKGGWIYLNDSDIYSEPGTTASEGHSLLELSSGTVGTLHVRPDCVTSRDLDFDIQLQPNGDARIDIVRRYRGTEHNNFVAEYSEMPPEEKRRYGERLASEIAQNARLLQPLRVSLDTYPAQMEMHLQVDKFAVRDGNRLYCQLPWVRPNELELKSDSRTLPLFMEEERKSRLTCRILGPASIEGLDFAPPSLSWESVAGHIRVRSDAYQPAAPAATPDSKTDGGSPIRPILRIQRDVDLAPAVFSAGEYPYLSGVNRELSHSRNGFVVLKIKPEESQKPATP